MRQPEIQELERLIYWQGQRLKSRDFRDQTAADSRLRSWHNRSLHETAGIVFGLEVKVQGAKVVVSRGLGYDREGREAWLAADAETPLPSAAGDFVVVISGQSVELVPDAAGLPDGLPLAMIAVGTGAVDLCARYVRPLARPRVALGETVSENTPWEIWSERFGQTEVAVGVQTRVDTSAAGFTRTPNYFATLLSDRWNVVARPGQPRPEFLPVYFAHIAEPAPDGFRFRLLLKDIARRQYVPRAPEAIAGTAAVKEPATLSMQGTGFNEFRVGDAVVLVRPRPARNARAALVLSAEDEELTLSMPVGARRVVLANLPRASRVTSTRAEGLSVITVAAAAGLKRHDVVTVFGADGTAVSARIRKASDNKLSLSRLIPGAATGIEYRTGAAASAARVSGTPVTTAAGTMTVPLKGNLTLFPEDAWVVDIDLPGGPSAPAQIAEVTAAGITLRSPLAGLKQNARLVPLGPLQTIVTAETDDPALTATVENGDLFAEGDVVMAADRQPVAVVRSVTGNDVHLENPGTFTVKQDEVLAAANWKAAAVPYFVLPAGIQQVALARLGEPLRPGDIVTVWDPAGDFEPRPERVARVAASGGNYFLTATPVPDLAAGAFVICGEFPARVTVSAVDSDGRIGVAPAPLRKGEWLAPLGVDTTGTTGGVQLAQVTETGVDGKLTLSQAIDNLAPGMALGAVHFRETGKVEKVLADGTHQLTEPFAAVRNGDLLAGWDHHADNSAVGIVQSIGAAGGGGQTASIAPPAGVAGLPGMVPRGVIDGGMLALAALTPEQSAVRLEEGAMPQTGDDLTVSGPNPTGAMQSLGMEPSQIDGDRLTLVLRQGAASYAIRPEQMSILSDFTDRFPSDFAVFAHRQKLSVSWMAVDDVPCQAEPPEEAEEEPCH